MISYLPKRCVEFNERARITPYLAGFIPKVTNNSGVVGATVEIRRTIGEKVPISQLLIELFLDFFDIVPIHVKGEGLYLALDHSFHKGTIIVEMISDCE